MSFDTKNVIAPTEVRPRFRLLTEFTVKGALEHIKEEADASDKVEYKAIMEQIDLKIPEKDRHYWSPVLHVNFETDENFDNTLVRCLIGPNQAVWTLFMLGYIAVGVLTLFGGMYGMVQWQLGNDSLFLWSFPAAAVILGAILLGAKFGQKKGHDQMIFLIMFLYKCLEKKDLKHL